MLLLVATEAKKTAVEVAVRVTATTALVTEVVSNSRSCGMNICGNVRGGRDTKERSDGNDE